jgi:hypothetical protein
LLRAHAPDALEKIPAIVAGLAEDEEEASYKGLCRLHTDTDATQPLDFQSFRRGLVTALADAEIVVHKQLAITGHTHLTTQQKHYMQKRRVRVRQRRCRVELSRKARR